MGNTFNTLAGTLVLQEWLASLLAQFPVIGQITRRFSGEGIEPNLNQQITTRVVVPTTATSYNQNNGYVETDRTTVDVNVTINQHYHVTFAVTDLEQSATNRTLRDELIATSVHALGTQIMSSLFSTVTAASYPLFHEASANVFDTARARKVKTVLNKAKVPDMDRFMVVNSDYAETLDIDSVIIANPNGTMQGENANPRPVKNIHGFLTSEYTDLPTGNEKLMGIAGNREAIIMASRVPKVPANPNEVPGIIQNVTEPNTGLTVQHRRYYDMKFAKMLETFALMWGFGVGLSETALSRRLVRIVTP
jgi:hypothetical protein